MLKEYIIWLENSDCIIGKAEREDILNLMKLQSKKCRNIVTFYDDEGITSINMKKVVAISMSRIAESGKAGF